MWKCSKCGENVADDFEVCWSCGTNKEGMPNPDFVPEQEGILGAQAYQAQQAEKREEFLVTVATFGNAPEAHMVRSLLEAEGIHAFVMGDMAATAWGFVNAPDAVQLQVPEKDAARARDVLKTVHRTPVPETEEEEESDEHIQANRDQSLPSMMRRRKERKSPLAASRPRDGINAKPPPPLFLPAAVTWRSGKEQRAQ